MTESQITLIIGSGVTIFAAIVGFFLNMLNTNRIEGKRRKDEAIKNHFQVLRKKVISPLISQLDIRSYQGELSPGGQGRHWTPDDIYFIPTIPYEDFNIFSLHFNEQSMMIQDLIKRMNEHNSKFDDYVKKLEERLNSIHPLSQKVLDSSFLYSQLIGIFRATLFQIAENSYKGSNHKLTHDFNVALINKENEYWVLSSETGSVRYARLTSSQEAEDCKARIIELQNSDKLQKRAVELSKEADSLEHDFSSMVNLLDFIRQYYTGLGNIMSKSKKCQYCQAIKS